MRFRRAPTVLSQARRISWRSNSTPSRVREGSPIYEVPPSMYDPQHGSTETQRKGITMKTQITKSWTIVGLTALASVTLFVMPALSHHSFAMYDQSKTVTLTGVVTQFVAQANHAELHFYAVGPDGKLMKTSDGKYLSWGVEMAGAAAVAQQGITATTFGAGTVFSVRMNPLRDGTNYGSRVGAI